MAATNKLQYKRVKQLNLPQIDKEILAFWQEHKIFEQSIALRKDAPTYVFYEGPPSVNGKPGIHHMMGRTIKDVFCRFHTLKGFQVNRKAGWDTHGLPIELAVEKTLGITKEDIGKSISVEEYNQKCREEALKYTDIWNDLTVKMGYWVDLDKPYVTFENNYIESLWHLLKKLYDKNLLYKGYTIQPYSPAAGTGLSSHELNMPGCYRDVKDISATAQFKVIENEQSKALFEATTTRDVFFLAWTTTPWTLPSNTALALGPKVKYVQVDTFNPYTYQAISVVLAKDLLHSYFKPENATLDFEEYKAGDKNIPYRVVQEYTGASLANIRYEQLLPYTQPDDGDAFKVIMGDFITTDSGTGIVHIAPSFGADDMRVARQNGIGSLTLVNKQGRFVASVHDFAGRPVKNYDNVPANEYRPVDVDIVIKLKQENKAFQVKKYEHSYPHCWRTDKPIIYYPLDSWFIRTTAAKQRMLELNKTINWKPASTGEGRFGNWLANLVDWNLSRSRFWGTPLPIWRTKDGAKEICIGSVAALRAEIDKAVAAGVMESQPVEDFDLHRPYIDRIVLVSDAGEPMYREPDLIDVWFDSGAMPYAQWHYPFENEEVFNKNYPANFIAEGVDQTRGWFFTLHAIAVMLFDSVAYKNVVSNGLLLDCNGVKMSKRLGNLVNPFDAMEKHGADANRWYMLSNSQPWDNLRFTLDGVEEVKRKFFGTLFNTYSFFAMYANIDGFTYSEAEIPVQERPEIDRWIISLLNSLVAEVDELFSSYEPTRACRLIQNFVGENLSNWYVRLCRRRFWKGEYKQDKIAAYQTLYHCLEVVTQLMSPVAPFFSDFLFQKLNDVTQRWSVKSVHLTDLPKVETTLIDKDLEERMQLAQNLSSMVLSLRKGAKIRVRQPLQRMLVPVLNEQQAQRLMLVKDLILSEVNVKELELVTDTTGIIKKRVRPNFKKLGRKLGRNMGVVKTMLEGKFDRKKGIWVKDGLSQSQIAQLEKTGAIELSVQGENIKLLLDELIISSEDIEGWQVNTMDGLTVALDTNISPALAAEGMARELVNRLQKIRKDSNLALTDRITVQIADNERISAAISNFGNYISTEILADSLSLVPGLTANTQLEIDDLSLAVKLEKVIG